MKITLPDNIKKTKYLIFLFILIFSYSTFAQQELKICALRVSFQVDQNPLTTGDGTFLLDSTNILHYTVDPPPHDRSYFQDQIIAVKNYFWQASRGQLNISGTVFPLAKTASYQLPNEMSYYNPNTNEVENNARLAQLFIDAVKLADNDTSIDFSQFDVITLFHAGVGKDIDVGFDETPQDIPSLYLSMNFFKNALGDTFSGIRVDNGAVPPIQNGLVLPETESQVDLQIALTGIFASNIASHLGMLDLFSPSEQVTGIGRFGLMDVGQFNMFGLLPAIPCAYSRLLAGWEAPNTISQPTNDIQVNRFKGEATSGQSIVKIPINSDEYYLLEYRGQRGINIDSVYFTLAENRTDPPTYLEVLQNYLPDKIKVSDSTGVVLNIENYDWGLPGAGILIWHIDEKVIAENKEKNRINDDPDNRGVDLEEADGSQDIGFSYSITEPGYQSELGTWLDFWFKSNAISPLYKNEFSPTSSPNTRSNRNYADSHIILNDFSNNFGDVMTFDFYRDYYENGFPVSLDKNNDDKKYSPLKAGRISSDKAVVITSDEKGNIYAITANGHGLFTDTTYLFAQFSQTVKTDLALADSDGDGFDDLLIATCESGTVNGFKMEDNNNDLYADTVFTFSVNAHISYLPVVKDPSFFITLDNGKIAEFDFTGNFLQDTVVPSNINGFVVMDGIHSLFASNAAFSPIVVDMDSDGDDENLVFPDSSTVEVKFGNEFNRYSTFSRMKGIPAIADVDLDGYYEIIYHTDQSISGMNFNGSYVTNLPLQPVLGENEKLMATPIIADINSDGKNEIISTTNQGQIFVHSLSGELFNGFPTTTAGKVEISPLLMDVDNDGKLEIFVLNQKGDLHAWQIDSDFSDENLWWTQENYAADNNLYLTRQLSPVSIQSNELLPANKIYNFPNPNREDYTYIRYFLSEPSIVNIKIFDLGGDIVDSFAAPGTGQVDHQLKWDVSEVSSGIYLCRVEAKSNSRSDVKIIKIMVVH